MRALLLLLLAVPAMAQNPGWRFQPICHDGQLTGLIIAAPAAGAVAVRFDAARLCAGAI